MVERTPMELLTSGNINDINRVLCDFSEYIGYPQAINAAMYELVKLYQAEDLAPHLFTLIALDVWCGRPSISKEAIINNNMLNLKALRDHTKDFGLLMLKCMLQGFIDYYVIPYNNMEQCKGLVMCSPTEIRVDIMNHVITKKPEWNAYLAEK